MEGEWKVCVIVPGPFGFNNTTVLRDVFSHSEGFRTGDILMELDHSLGRPVPDKFEEAVWSAVKDGRPMTNIVYEFRTSGIVVLWWLERT